MSGELSRVLVTGATGNIGGYLVRRLTERSSVTAVPCYRKPADAEAFRSLGLSPVPLDMDRPESAREALSGIDILFLLKPYTIRMLIQSKIMLDAARSAGVRHVIHLGAHGADDIPWATIGWNHMVERYVEALGFGWTHLRPNFFMDNLLRSARPLTDEDGNPADLPEARVTHFLGERPISWISCRDIAAVAAAVIQNPQAHHGKVYPLAVQQCSMPGLAVMLSELTGRQYRYQRLSPETGFEMMTKLGREPEFVRPWLDYMAAVADGKVPGTEAVFDNIEPLTGEKPTLLEDFIRENRERFS